MELNEVEFPGQPPVDGYGPGFFRVGGKKFDGNVLILPGGIYPWAGYGDWDRVMAQKSQIDLLFVGTGEDIDYLPASDLALLEEAGIQVEAISSAAAARTYNVLLSEERRVAAALLAVEKKL